MKSVHRRKLLNLTMLCAVADGEKPCLSLAREREAASCFTKCYSQRSHPHDDHHRYHHLDHGHPSRGHQNQTEAYQGVNLTTTWSFQSTDSIDGAWPALPSPSTNLDANSKTDRNQGKCKKCPGYFGFQDHVQPSQKSSVGQQN